MTVSTDESVLSFGVRVGHKVFWRAVWTPRSSVIKREVEEAYLDRQGPPAAKLRTLAQTAWGLTAGNRERAKEYIRLAHLAQIDLRHAAIPLAQAPLGFEDIKINAHCADAHSSRIYLDGFDESESVFNVYRDTAKAGTAAIDVGANIGTHSLVLSRLVGETGRVFSYEPNPATARKLAANLTLNDTRNVMIRPVGAGSECSTVRFNDGAGEFNSGFARIDPNGAIEVPIKTIDSDYSEERAVNVIKIDVEGLELEVLRGAQAVLKEHHPAVILECNEWTYQDLADVIPYSFKVFRIPFNPSLRPQLIGPPYRMGRVGYNIFVQPSA